MSHELWIRYGAVRAGSRVLSAPSPSSRRLERLFEGGDTGRRIDGSCRARAQPSVQPPAEANASARFRMKSAVTQGEREFVTAILG